MQHVALTHGDKVVALAAGMHQAKDFVGMRRAAGAFTFGGQPTAADTITINGVVFTFRAAADPDLNEITIGANAEGTIDNAVTKLNASVDAAVALATYSKSGTTKLVATYDAYSTDGNDFTIAENAANVTVAAATLLGGVSGDRLVLDAETKALVTVAATAETTISEFDLPAGAEGQETTVYLKTKGTSSNAKVNGAFAGGTSITFDTAGEWAKLKWLDASWKVIVNTGVLA